MSVYVLRRLACAGLVGLCLFLPSACQRATCPSYRSAVVTDPSDAGKVKGKQRRHDKNGRIVKRNRNPFRVR
ncbi:MAG: hypothetical protein WBA12_05560 [Catalinimonas sp.]